MVRLDFLIGLNLYRSESTVLYQLENVIDI